MEPEGSLPYSQVPTTCPYPEPARSSPYAHIPLKFVIRSLMCFPSTCYIPRQLTYLGIAAEFFQIGDPV